MPKSIDMRHVCLALALLCSLACSPAPSPEAAVRDAGRAVAAHDEAAVRRLVDVDRVAAGYVEEMIARVKPDPRTGEAGESLFGDKRAWLAGMMASGGMRFVRTGEWGNDATGTTEEGRAIGERLFATDYRIGASTSDGERATVAVTAMRGGASWPLTVHLERQRGAWRVVALDGVRAFVV